MEKLICTCLLFSFSTFAVAKGLESMSVGGSVGYSNSSLIGAEGYFQAGFRLWSRPFEPKIGFNYTPFNATFKGKTDLKTENIGFFVEGVFYPFHKFLYLGLRWETINVNWFPPETLQRLESDMSFIIFTGTCLFGVAGVAVPLWKNGFFKVYVMPGIQQYRVSDGTFSSGSYVVDGTIQENHFLFCLRGFAGISVRLFSR